jgi:hypothetical protein
MIREDTLPSATAILYIFCENIATVFYGISFGSEYFLRILPEERGLFPAHEDLNDKFNSLTRRRLCINSAVWSIELNVSIDRRERARVQETFRWRRNL